VQPSPRGRGKRLLYWFRTPPGVRVGRAPIDETAIRLLEQHNPDVEFDWTRILKAPPAAEAPARRDRDARDRDQRGRREPRPPQRSRSGGAPAADPRPPRPEPRALSDTARRLGGVEGRADADAATTGGDAAQAPEAIADSTLAAWEAWAAAEPEPPVPAETDVVETTDVAGEVRDSAFGAEGPAVALAETGAQAAPEAEPLLDEDEPVQVFEARPEDVGSASYQRLGAEGLVRLRARYAEVMARIAERPMEDQAREELQQRAERLNPDAWVTADEVSAALEQYETVFEGLRGVVGRHPRRRRRGRR
jgi:hypothetical protein